MPKLPMGFARVRWLASACQEPRCLLSVLLLLGAAARVRQYLAQTSYWHDEAFLLLNVFPRSFIELIGPLSHEQAAPPLFLWLLRACYLTLGPAELALRLPAFVASLAALVLMVPLARAVVGGKSWLWPVACAALSSSLLYLTCQVKPYTTDVLVAEAVLLAACGCLTPDLSSKSRRASQLSLALSAVIGPWLSFPSVFVIGGACLTLILRSIANVAVRSAKGRSFAERKTTMPPPSAVWVHARDMIRGSHVGFPAMVSSLLLASCLALWLAAARHHNTPYQQSFWSESFVDLSGPMTALAWLGRKLLEVGNYGVQGTGMPMALLAAVGFVGCWRRQPWLSLALVLPAGLACMAAATRHYPLGNRLLAFLFPCLWLLAAEGVAVVTMRLRTRAAWLALVPAALLLPAVVYTARYAIFAKPSVEFREAFHYVRQQMRDNDSLWVSQPEVYEVYFGRGDVLGPKALPATLAAAVERGRVWMLCHPPAEQTHLADEARRHVEATGAMAADRLEFVHLDVTVYSPPGYASLESPPYRAPGE